MKVAGWICTILGILALIGSLMSVANGQERNIGGPIVFLLLGVFFLVQAKKKDKENKDFENWTNDKK